MVKALVHQDPLTLAAEAARKVLEAGSETYRAEVVFMTLCRVWKHTDIECFAIPTGVMASSTDASGVTRSVVRRIQYRYVDLNRIARIVELVERAERESLSPEAFNRLFSEINSEQPYPFWVKVLASGLCAAFFCLMFGGLPGDAVAAFFVGLAIRISIGYASFLQFPDFILNVLGGAVASSVAALFVVVGLAANLDKTIIGSIMLLVPGLATVNAIRDTIAGDLVAGVARLADAFMTAAALSLGAGLALAAIKLVGQVIS